ncbi:hypothetical protein AOLI_G00134010 [Acnodon oligacanthus]
MVGVWRGRERGKKKGNLLRCHCWTADRLWLWNCDIAVISHCHCGCRSHWLERGRRECSGPLGTWATAEPRGENTIPRHSQQPKHSTPRTMGAQRGGQGREREMDWCNGQPGGQISLHAEPMGKTDDLPY